MTGMSTARLTAALKSRNGAAGVPMEGMTRASDASLSMCPLITETKSIPSAM